MIEGPVMVVGARGFIGRHLAAALGESGLGTQHGIRPEVDLADADVTSRALERHRPAQVVNLSRVGGHWPGGARAERDAAQNLVNAALASGCERLVHFGSGLEYGSAATDIGEGTELRPDTEFGRGKAEATELVLAADGEDIRTSVLRPFTVYGPGEPAGRLITSAASAALDGRPLPLTVPGLRRDWLFVADVVDATRAALAGGADGEHVDLAAGRTVANEEVAALAAAATGAPLQVEHGSEAPRPWDVRRQRVSTAKAERLLGWRASISLKDGIGLTVAPLLRVRSAGRVALA